LLVVVSLILHQRHLALEIVTQEPAEFISESFEQVPELRVLWFTQEIRDGMLEILEHHYPGLRLRYWIQNQRTAWILEEIGKVKPITAGFVVEDNNIQHMQVLIYRESHGGEVRFPFFSNQFKGAALDDRKNLTQSIDGISGATLSVNALTRLARVALFLHTKVVE